MCIFSIQTGLFNSKVSIIWRQGMANHKFNFWYNILMTNNNLIFVASIIMVSIMIHDNIVNGEKTGSNFFTEFQKEFEKSTQVAFAFDRETINVDLVINTSTLKIHDLNNNKYPDAGELSTVLGTLYSSETQNELGIYRASFIWGILDNSTNQAPVSLGTQVFDIKDNGTIVVIGDIVTDSRNGSGSGISVPIDAAIAGGTGKYNGIVGSAIMTERFYDPGKALYLDVILNMVKTLPYQSK